MSKIIEIRAPKTLGGESVTEGIVKIKKNIGEAVKVDDLIFEIETDKTALELTAEASGQITEFLVKEDDVISPDQLLAKLSVGEVKEEARKEDKSESAAKKDAPSARKIMEENSINAESVKGTGMGGRVTKADVIGHINKTEQPAIKQYELPKSAVSGERREERAKMSKIRQVIAARLKASQNTAAILTTFNEIDMKNVMDLRAKYKDTFEKKIWNKTWFYVVFYKGSSASTERDP